jgi:hypothetical protein
MLESINYILGWINGQGEGNSSAGRRQSSGPALFKIFLNFEATVAALLLLLHFSLSSAADERV